MNMNIRDFFKAAGFREGDTIVQGKLTVTSTGSKEWKVFPITVREYADFISRGNLPHSNFYYSHATHNGAKNDTQAAFGADNFQELVCMVIDIDYGGQHKRESPYRTKEEALAASETLPRPTALIHSGGGLQLVYRFRNRISGHEGKEKYKTLSKTLGSQVYADACQGIGHVFRTPFTKNCKNMDLIRDVEILEMNPEVDYTLTELEEYCHAHNFKLPSSGQQKHKSISVKKARQKKQPGDRDNSRDAFLFIDNFLRQYPGTTDRSLLAAMKKHPSYVHYAEKGEKAEQYCRQDIRRIKQKLTQAKRPRPFTAVRKLKYAGEPVTEEAEAARERFNTVYDTSGNERITIALSLMEQLYLKQEKAILNFPCASGKTTAAMILAAAHASPENRFWIVTQKIEDVKRIAEFLRQIGCNAKEWHGRSSECPVPRLEFISKKRGFFCRKCETSCTARLKYLAMDVWDAPDADVLVTTHSHWAAAVIQEKIPESVKYVIVDESPTLMEYFTLNEEKVMDFRGIFFQNSRLRKWFDADIGYIQAMLYNGNCRRIPELNTLSHTEEIQKCLYLLLGRGEISPELFEQMQIFLDFFSSPEVYGIRENRGWNETMAFIRGTVDLQTSIPHLILDGSALMSDVRWRGFHIFNCPELKQTYSNTTIEVINGNPSKAFLSNRDNFDQLAEAVIRMVEPENTLLLFRNKELSFDSALEENIATLRSRLQNEVGVELLELNRGEHIGSNKGRTAQVNAVCMSLFSTLSYYVLRTALVHHREIPAREIWRKLFRIPAMKRNGGFVSEEIEETYCRTISLDLYQTIMRGCIRDNPANSYKVVCAVSGLDIISVLKEELPGATFHYENEEIVNALLDGEAESDIIRLMPPELSERSRYDRLEVIRRAVGL